MPSSASNSKQEKPEGIQKPASPKIVFNDADYLAEIRQQNYIEPTPSSIRDKTYEAAIPKVLYGWRLAWVTLWDLKIVLVFEATIMINWLLIPASSTYWVFLFSPALTGICLLVGFSLHSAKQKQQLYYAFLSQHVLIDYHNWRWYFHVDMIMLTILSLVLAYCFFDKVNPFSSLGTVLTQTIGLISIIYSNVIDLEAQLISLSKLAENEGTRRKVTEGWTDLEVVTEDVLIAYLKHTKKKLNLLVKLYQSPFWGCKPIAVAPPILVSRADLLKFRANQKDSIKQLSWIHSSSLVTPYGYISACFVRFYTGEKSRANTNATELNSDIMKSTAIPYNPVMKAVAKTTLTADSDLADPTEKV